MLARCLFVEEHVRHGRRVNGFHVLRQDELERGCVGTAGVLPRRVLPDTRERGACERRAGEFHVQGKHIGQSGQHALIFGGLGVHAGGPKVAATSPRALRRQAVEDPSVRSAVRSSAASPPPPAPRVAATRPRKKAGGLAKRPAPGDGGTTPIAPWRSGDRTPASRTAPHGNGRNRVDVTPCHTATGDAFHPRPGDVRYSVAVNSKLAIQRHDRARARSLS